MKIDILICAIGGQNVREYIDFFDKLARALNEYLYIDTEKGFSPERTIDRYSVRIGGGYGPILEGGADVVISLEQAESLKFRFYPKDEGGMVIADEKIIPMPVIQGIKTYPKDCAQKCLNTCFKVFEYNSNPLVGCLLALRIIGFTKERVLELLGVYFAEIEGEIDSVYAQKYVKA